MTMNSGLLGLVSLSTSSSGVADSSTWNLLPQEYISNLFRVFWKESENPSSRVMKSTLPNLVSSLHREMTAADLPLPEFPQKKTTPERSIVPMHLPHSPSRVMVLRRMPRISLAVSERGI